MSGNTKDKELNQGILKENTMTQMRKKDKNKDRRTAMRIGENFIMRVYLCTPIFNVYDNEVLRNYFY